MKTPDNAADRTARDDTMSFEDLLLIGGVLMAIAVFSGSHAHAAQTDCPACATGVIAVSQVRAAH